jgi:glycosyltransferase involved in cell wall biosynthesis
LNIAFFHHTLRLGSGIDTVIYELANRLAKYEDVTVFCFKTNYTEKDCNFHLQKIRSSFGNTTTKIMVLSPFILDKFGTLKSDLKRFDIVNTHHYPASYIIRNMKVPLHIVTEWSAVQPSMFSSIKEKLYVKWTRHANRVSAEKADVVLAPCEFVKNWILRNYSIHAITMFLDGVNFTIFDKNKVTADKILKLYPNRDIEKKKIILFVGRITESKNIHSLIEAFSLVKQKISDIILLLVGDYESYTAYYMRLLKLIKAKNVQDDVIFTGIVSWEDLPSYFAACTIYATCSLWEGFLRAESFAFNKPIICFNIGANSETVHDGETGFMIDDLNVDRFAERMYDLLTNDTLANKMGENGYHWAKNNLDFDSISKRFRIFCQSEIRDHKHVAANKSFDT